MNYSENTRSDEKVAIVVETGLHTAMANEYTRIGESIPLELILFF